MWFEEKVRLAIAERQLIGTFLAAGATDLELPDLPSAESFDAELAHTSESARNSRRLQLLKELGVAS